MSHVTYKIVQHDGGWAYTVDGVFSEPLSDPCRALAAAKRAAAEQRVPGRTEAIEYETADGKWHTEPPPAATVPRPISRTSRSIPGRCLSKIFGGAPLASSRIVARRDRLAASGPGKAADIREKRS